jgi:ribonuclease P protein subunit RPR2
MKSKRVTPSAQNSNNRKHTFQNNVKKSNNIGTTVKNHSSKKSRHRGRPGRRTKDMVDIAKSRIKTLLMLAERELLQNQNQTRARRYVTLARKIGMRYNVRLEKYYRNKVCRSCNSYLITSFTSRIRCRGKKIITYCLHCGNTVRIPIHDRHKPNDII